MPLRLVNNPDIGLAQEWLVQLHLWLHHHGCTGYDPFDVKSHPLLRAVQHRPLLRKASTLWCDCFPVLTRKMLGTRPSLNPKTLALVALGRLRLFQITGDQVHLDQARETLSQLRKQAHPDFPGLCWGYPFAVHATGLDTPANTPVGVVCAIAGQAFLLAHDITREDSFLEQAREIGIFMAQILPRIPCDDGQYCFAYTPADRRRVHNANLLAVEHLVRTGARTGDDAWAALAAPALQFTLEAQRADGAWPYGAWKPDEPYEPGLLRLVDHHHTGFVLRSLHAIQAHRNQESIADALRRGVAFYRTLIRPDGMPVNEYGAWPVDIHACAEGILCPSALAPSFPAFIASALQVIRWTHWNLRNPVDGAPWHRKYPLGAARIVFPRWGAAWMYRALAEYLYQRQFHRHGASPPKKGIG